MPETKHTALPWHVGGDGELIWIGQPNGDDAVICDIVPRVHGKPPTEEDEANAAFIVTAVNSHAALVAAATDALNALDSRYDGTSDGRTLWMGRHIDALRKALMAGRAAKGATAL